MSQLSFAVYAGVPALPGTLIIEIQSIPQIFQNKSPVIMAQLKERVLGQLATATAPANAPSGDALMSRAWGPGWIVSGQWSAMSHAVRGVA